MRRASLSLFTGAGGLDLGLEAAGFNVRLCVERDHDSRASLRANRPRWRLSTPGDIQELSSDEVLRQARVSAGDLSLVAGGPPCQPFSKSGYWRTGDARRLSDPRSSTLDSFLHVVEATLPEVVLLENVRGLVYKNKDEGVRLVRTALESINDQHGTSYEASLVVLNAAEYGVPQLRERVFLIAHREGKVFTPPPKTHSATPDEDGLLPFATAWDAIGDLDLPDWDDSLTPTGKWADLLPSIPEGKNYLWHTERMGGEPLFGWRTRYWSFLLKLARDRPSWTVQATPGPSTGPFHWRNRKLSIRELARLQTFPDDYQFVGSVNSALRQIGNAVPPAVGEVLGREIRRQLLRGRPQGDLSFRLAPRPGMIDEAPPVAVPARFLNLRGSHNEHPGNGKGPGASRRDR